MKISLVVASGVHKGKSIPILGDNFSIGRDEACHLRPASPAVSKFHCGISIRDKKVYVRDLGSTNGTFVNDVQLEKELECRSGDRIKVGPLDFALAIESVSDSTPLPNALKSVPGKPTKSGGFTAGGAKTGSSSTQKPAAPTSNPAQKPAPEKKVNAPAPIPRPSAMSEDESDAAAMLLAMTDDDDSSPPSVPEGSTVMELPAVDAMGGFPGKTEPKAEEKKPVESSASVADSLLKKYLRRPGTPGAK